MGDEELVESIIEVFLDDIPNQIQALKNFLESGDVVDAIRQAHTIKGAAANVSAEAMRAVAFDMEKIGKLADQPKEIVISKMREKLLQLDGEFERFKNAI
jgi:HPt (histidine-containing phosphotransfer) domain-containing protein